ncbi:MAG: HAD family hydrolase [Lachnospiraceae bacterium]|nr:HAD family hydrolase [Lachnospiraceae bacterium]
MSMATKHRSLLSYRAVVWDLDGTLYFQKKMRLIMAAELVKFYLLHPFRIKELLAVRKFRKIRENWHETEVSEKTPGTEEGLAGQQYAYTASLLKMSKEEVKDAVEEWIYRRPLEYIRRCRDDEAAGIFDLLKKHGISCFIFSDYPIADKLEALGLSADGYYEATDERLGVLKPDPKGLKLIMADHGYGASDIIMIGDRDSRDGEAARRAGCDYLILSSSKKIRNEQYKALLA